MSLITQLLQKGVELGRFPIPFGKNLLRGHGVLRPQILDDGGVKHEAPSLDDLIPRKPPERTRFGGLEDVDP